ncbi:phosphate ABC transporter permease subunit PstC [Methylomarinum sp. Ch1-1]|uniref:Phosphate transport system permease protein n=1 Tax=Methylomarinum roseum TaxID=3067653 RepID=A0AAU7NZI6_9GAMM|nr:phosphate ABC transporter permease subunit PstC [Methylomarinum sp. Ch1-1]MDP4521460.1 phosphate ABC transporter permease subunit PstC [Methylomarinum sp. Ch1-1]
MTSSQRNTLSLSRPDKKLAALLRLCALVSAAVVLLIMLFLIDESRPLLDHLQLSRFFTDRSWHPVQGLYNLTPMLSATLFSTAGALLLALPLGIASALFSRFYAPPTLAAWYRRLIELLAGIPSVVYGFWGLTTVAPWVARLHPPGVSLLTAILILALMILPTVALTVDAALAALPVSHYRGAAALGLSRWGMISGVALPAARAGIASGSMLAAGRAMGETMAVLMVAGNVVQHPHSLFDSVRTLTANIALEMAYAMGDHRAALFASGLALMLMVLALVGAAELFKWKSAHD